MIMVKLKKCLKRNVVAVDKGIRLGRPADALIDPRTHRIAWIVLLRGKAEEACVVFPGSAVHSFAEDYLAIDGVEQLSLAYRERQALEVLQQGWKFPGRAVLTRRGDNLGRIVDVHIDDRGRVTEYLVRKGVLGWFKKARHIFPSELQTSGEDVAVTRDGDVF